MDPFVVIIVSCLILGSVVGILAGMLGIGGGLIIVPALSYLLVHFMGMTTETVMPVAIATSLSTIIFTGTSSALAHYKLGNIQRYIVLYTGLGIAFGAIAGAQVASHMSGELLKDVFAVLVILIALQMIFGKQKASDNEASKSSENEDLSDTSSDGGSAQSTPSVAGPVQSREQAFKQLEQISQFFKTTEPHSPLSYLLQKSVRWGKMSLPELMKELLPDDSAREHFSNLTGAVIEEDED